MTTTFDELTAGARVAGYGPDPGPDRTEVAKPVKDRSPWLFFWTWLATPHIEFAAIYVGMIAVYFIDLSFTQALLGVFLGTAFGAVTHGLLTATGVRLHMPPIALGKLAFGAKGNMIVTTVMAVLSSLGWFTVNSVVAALALNALFGIKTLGALAIIVVLQLLVAALGTRVNFNYGMFQRILFPITLVLMVIAGIITFVNAEPSSGPATEWNLNALIAIVVVACMAWAYTVGWGPYATDYSSYAPTVSPKAAGFGAAFGLFCSSMFLMSVGVAAAIAVGLTDQDNPVNQFTDDLPTVLGVLVLLGFLIGSFSSNTITLGSVSKLVSLEKAGVSAAANRAVGPLLWTVLAFLLGWAALQNVPSNFEGFIMVVGYWIGPWLNTILMDQYIKRKVDVTGLLYDSTLSYKWGLFSVAIAVIGSVCLYALQVFDGGRMPHGGVSYAALGMLVGFYASAVVYGLGLKKMIAPREQQVAKRTVK